MNLFYFAESNGNRYRLFRPQIALDSKVDVLPSRWTHFISIPLNRNGKFNAKLEDFGQLSRKLIPRFDEKTLVAPPKLHLTVCMLKLPSKKEIAEVIDALSSKDLFSNIKQETVHLKDLCIMKGTPDKAQVLYCDVDDSAMLDDIFATIRSNLKSRAVGFEDTPAKVS